MSEREREIDWSVLEYPDVRAVARKAASKVATDYINLATWDFDDLLQEAYINLATRPEVVREYLEGPDGTNLLYHDILMDLVNLVTPEAERRFCKGTRVEGERAACGATRVHEGHPRSMSFDALQEVGKETADERPASATDTPVGDYSRELVEQLLPAVWDRSMAYGMTNPNAPDPDMPGGAIDVSHGCTLYAHLADIKTAWKRAPLTLKEKRAVLLRHGLGWDHREIAELEGVSRKVITVRLDTAVGKMRDHLNGADLRPLTW